MKDLWRIIENHLTVAGRPAKSWKDKESMIQYMIKHGDWSMDWENFFEDFMVMQYEDYLYGRLGKLRAEASRQGWTASPRKDPDFEIPYGGSG